MRSSARSSARPAERSTRSSQPSAGQRSAASLIDEAGQIADGLAAEASRWDRDGKPNRGAYSRIRASRIGALRVPLVFGGSAGRIADLTAVTIALARGDASVAEALLPHFIRIEWALLAPQTAFATALLARAGAGDLLGLALAASAATSAEAQHTQREEAEGDGMDRMGQRGAISGTLLLDSAPIALPMAPYTRSDKASAHAGHPNDDVHAVRAISEILHAAIDVGIAQAALADAARWVREGVRPVKESGVERAGDDPFILHTLGRVQAYVQAAEAMVLTAADAADAEDAANGADAGGALRGGRAARDDGTAAERVSSVPFVDSVAWVAAAQARAASTEAALLAAQALFDVGGASTTLRKHNFDRHWRNARTHTARDPLDHHYRAIGAHHLNGCSQTSAFPFKDQE